jgi:hypothetical protein
MSREPTRVSLSLAGQIVERILRLPRFARIGLCALFALAVTLALSPLIDEIYLRFFFSAQTVIAPSLISAVFGLVMYVTGWLLVIGTRGETPPARLGVLWYVLVGILALIVVVFLVVRGVSLLNLAARPI